MGTGGTLPPLETGELALGTGGTSSRRLALTQTVRPTWPRASPPPPKPLPPRRMPSESAAGGTGRDAAGPRATPYLVGRGFPGGAVVVKEGREEGVFRQPAARHALDANKMRKEKKKKAHTQKQPKIFKIKLTNKRRRNSLENKEKEGEGNGKGNANSRRCSLSG